jgi:hypothetical protein
VYAFTRGHTDALRIRLGRVVGTIICPDMHLGRRHAERAKLLV